jgi:hypothetical protein
VIIETGPRHCRVRGPEINPDDEPRLGSHRAEL